MSKHTQSEDTVLRIENLSIDFQTTEGTVHAVKNIHCHIQAGECLGIVGESGSGKSQTFLAVMNLLAKNASVSGSIHYKGAELLSMGNRERSELSGDRLSMIFQDPLTSLTPHMKVGDQMREVLTVHQNTDQAAAKTLCIDWLDRVRIPEAKARINAYPHELSGGMRQRVMIAMAMLCKPDLLIADEPSTALDVTVQADILDLMTEIREELNTAIALITHDMGVVARMCQRIVVMQDGEFVEQGAVDELFYSPQQAYTKMLLEAVPRLKTNSSTEHKPEPLPTSEPTTSEPIINAKSISAQYKLPGTLLSRSNSIKAVNDVSLTVYKGETLGIVGESGSGKSTLARCLIRLKKLSAGEVVWLGRDLHSLNAPELRKVRKDLQIVFQDPLASLDPARPIGYSIGEPLSVHEPNLNKDEVRDRVNNMMERVGLDIGFYNRYPHELSGGQNQRVGIARAMIMNPKLVICDEAVSALDVSIQAQIIELLESLQSSMGVSIVFISHDLSVVSQLADRVLVMHQGSVMELADSTTLFSHAQHPYTKQLIAAVPIPDPKLEAQRQQDFRLRREQFELDIQKNSEPSQLNEVAPGHWVSDFSR